MNKTLFVFISIAIICIAFVSLPLLAADYTPKTLPSGRVIKIAGIGKMFFSKDEPALMLKYYTDTSISDTSALRKEAEDIWSSFKVDVERSGLNSAIISANEMPRGIISKTRGYNFVLKRQRDHTWIMLK